MSDAATGGSPVPTRRWFWIGLATMVLLMLTGLVFVTEDTADVTRTNAPPPMQLVTVLDVGAADAIATVTAFAELRPRWDSEIRAAVSGRIVKVHDAALAGERVAAGTPLIAIEKTRFERDVAAAELSLEEANLGLWRAQNGVALARGEFKRAGRSAPNELALRIPQLRIAERTRAAAEAQLEAARRRLADTDVKAPFSGFVIRRMASLGQTVSAGEALLRLSDDSQFELTAELSEADWALLDHPIASQTADLFRRDGTPLGQARIRRGGGFLDQRTRQRRVFLEVLHPGDGVLAGDFVRVRFTGRTIANTLTVPESALTRAGYVWLVNGSDQLIRVRPEVHFRVGGQLVIATPEGSPENPIQSSRRWRVAAAPLASFLPGQRVAPQIAED